MEICVNNIKCNSDSEKAEINRLDVWGWVNEELWEAQITKLKTLHVWKWLLYSPNLCWDSFPEIAFISWTDSYDQYE